MVTRKFHRLALTAVLTTSLAAPVLAHEPHPVEFAIEREAPVSEAPATSSRRLPDEPVLVHATTGGFLEGLHATGGTIGYTVEERDNSPNLLGQREDLERSTFGVKLAYGKFVKEGLLVGAAIEYDWSKSDQTLRSDDLLGRPVLRSAESTSNRVLVAPFARYYIPLGDGERAQLYLGAGFGLFYGWGEREEFTAAGSVVSRPSQSYGFDLQLRPGLSFIVLQGFAIDLSIGSLGLEFVYEEVGKGADESTTVKSDLNLALDVDLLTVDIGLTYYF